MKEGVYTLLRNNSSSTAETLRRRILGKRCFIDTAVVITNPDNFASGDNCALYHGTYILNTAGHVKMGNASHLGSMCYINVRYGQLIMGDNVAVGPQTSLLAYSNHYAKGRLVTDEKVQQDVRIGSNVLIGAHCCVLPGSTIGDNVIVGAGSVIRGNLRPNAIYAGVPCKMIRDTWYE